jgi:hypothetical protein
LNRECAAFAHLTVNRNFPAVDFDQSFTDCQPQSDPARFGGEERLENF